MKDYSQQINDMRPYENNQCQNLAVLKNLAARQTGSQPSKQALHKKYLDDFKVAQQVYMHQVLQRDEDELEELEGTVEGFKMVLRRMDKLVEILNNDNLPEDRGPDSVAHGDWQEDIGLCDIEC